ncbi:MAG: hypothetical protein CVV24_00795 [Ignavibacteriae bacterium HGW-Ignavibacteriae-3]|nr:MAG: hypothetical protein CVV24_00795 [Ignavibacteriae bacterium HGW-Ignavibacteriae-3]
MKKAITLLMMIVIPLVFIESGSQNTSLVQISEINAQSVKAPADAGKDLMEGLAKLTSNKKLKSGLHTIFTSESGAKYCVVLKNGKVSKLIITSSEGAQLKPKYSKTEKGKPCVICVTVSKNPPVEECWEWQCGK